MEDNENPIIQEQRESVKLIRNSKGFNWEIKLILTDNDDADLKRLDKFNIELTRRYGIKND